MPGRVDGLESMATLSVRSRQASMLTAILLLCASTAALLLYGSIAAVYVAVLPAALVAALLFARETNALLVGFALLVPLAGLELLPHQFHRFVYYPLTPLLALFLTATGFVSGRTAGRTPRLQRIEIVGLTLFGISIVASYVNANLHGWVTKDTTVHAVTGIEMVLLMLSFAIVPSSMNQVRTITLTLIGSAVLACALLLTLPAAIGEGGMLGGKLLDTPFGTANLNAFGTIIASSAVIALAMAQAAHETRHRLLLMAAFLVLAATLVFTKSRGAWMGLGAGLIYLALSSRARWMPITLAIIAALLVSSAAVRTIVVARFTETNITDPSLIGRLLLWKYALVVAAKNWLFGCGLENYRVVKHMFGYPFPMVYALRYNAHNIYLEAFVDLGIVGLAILLWLLVGSFVRSSNAVKSHDASDLGLALSAGIVAYAAHGLVDCIFFQQGVFALLGMLVGLSISLKRLTAGTASAGGLTLPEPPVSLSRVGAT